MKKLVWRCDICGRNCVDSVFYEVNIKRCKWEKIPEGRLLRTLAKNTLIVCENCAEKLKLKDLASGFLSPRSNQKPNQN